MPDLDQFAEDLSDESLAAAVKSSTTSAQQLGITNVPYFVIGNQTVSGAQPIGSFQQVIDAELTTTTK